MRWSRCLIPTLRQVPTEAVVPSHRLMLRAGLIQQVASGSYTYLPLGYRVLRKVMQIVREEMDRAGAVELFMPSLQPVELWEQTGRREAYGENLFVVKDRHGRELALGPTHEEVVTDVIKRSVHSYRDLPLTVYQIQTKFRDEFRPRFGVLRSREFQMKDAYSFDLAVEGLDASYDAMFNAYCRIFERCGLHYVTVEAESGPIGGSASHEFMIPSPTGEDTILSSDKGNYAANVEKCEIGDRVVATAFEAADVGKGATLRMGDDAPATGAISKLHTPGAKSIPDLLECLKKNLNLRTKPENTLKVVMYTGGSTTADEVAKTVKAMKAVGGTHGYATVRDQLMVVVRGDHEVNEGKLKVATGYRSVQIQEEADLERQGFPVGFLGPQLVCETGPGVKVVVDADATQSQFWITGANEKDYHVKHFDWKRDVLDPLGRNAKDRVQVADIRNAVAGDPSPKNDGGVLQEARGIEVGHVFKLGTKYSESLNLTILDEQQQERHPRMGCYGIGVNRIIAAAIEAESGHDDGGIIWPVAMAPYHALITPIRYEGEMQAAADRLYEELQEAGVEVLLDDRAERPGVKFKDADLIGIPLRLTVGDKGLANGEIEFKPRAAEKADMVPLDEVVRRVREFLGAG